MASIPSVLLLLLLLSLSHLHFTLPTGDNHATDRKSLEIIIGGGDPPQSPSPEPEPEDCPPPPPPPCPPPPPSPCPPPTPSPSPPPPPQLPPRSHPKPTHPPRKPRKLPTKPPHSPPKPPTKPPHSPPKPPTKPPGQPRPQQGFESPLLAKVYPILQNFKNNLVGKDPNNILKTWVGNDICNKNRYLGLECAVFPNTTHKAVASIQFNGFNFGGPNLRLHDFLDKLEEVTIFHANSNNFLGSVPEVSNLKYLFELDLSNNKLTGDFPTSVLKAKDLTFLDLRFNTFSGGVPSQVFNLDLDVLFINNNNLVQPLPTNLGSITALYLTFANNRFTGPIPGSIGNIKFLQEVLFLNNQLTGCLPYEIGKLNRAIVFDVGNNRLTGPIPYSFGCLENMEQLNLARNEFYDPIPENLCEISNLKNLSLSYNYFTQVGPKCRELIKRNILDVRMNCILDLPDQRTRLECANFFMRRQTCSNAKSMSWIPCGKNKNRVTLDQERVEKKETQASSPVSYGMLNPDRIGNR